MIGVLINCRHVTQWCFQWLQWHATHLWMIFFPAITWLFLCVCTGPHEFPDPAVWVQWDGPEVLFPLPGARTGSHSNQDDQTGRERGTRIILCVMLPKLFFGHKIWVILAICHMTYFNKGNCFYGLWHLFDCFRVTGCSWPTVTCHWVGCHSWTSWWSSFRWRTPTLSSACGSAAAPTRTSPSPFYRPASRWPQNHQR